MQKSPFLLGGGCLILFASPPSGYVLAVFFKEVGKAKYVAYQNFTESDIVEGRKKTASK